MRVWVCIVWVRVNKCQWIRNVWGSVLFYNWFQGMLFNCFFSLKPLFFFCFVLIVPKYPTHFLSFICWSDLLYLLETSQTVIRLFPKLIFLRYPFTTLYLLSIGSWLLICPTHQTSKLNQPGYPQDRPISQNQFNLKHIVNQSSQFQI